MNALVLGGGGSRGSYQVGALKALKELNIEFDIVSGTSIGALNGCLVVQDDYEYMYDIWNTISINDIVLGEFDKDFALENIFYSVDDFKNTIKHFKINKVDISPFINLIKRSYNKDKFLNSSKIFFATSTLLPLKTEVNFTNEDMLKDGINTLLCSASCFPVFPIAKHNNKHYVDGGYSDNLPINIVLKYNPNNIYIIDLDYNITHQSYKNLPNTIYIYPKENIGSFLNFDTDQIQKNITLGYNDVYKYYKKYLGYKYTFIKYNNTLIDDIYNIFIKENTNIIDYYSNKLNTNYTRLDLFISILEDILDIMEFKTELIYDINILLKDIKYAFKYHINNKDINYKLYAEAIIKKVINKSKLETLILYINNHYNNEDINIMIDQELYFLSKVVIHIIHK